MDISKFRVTSASKVDLSTIDTHAPDHIGKRAALDRTAVLTARLAELQYLLYAESKHKVLAVLQATDTGGKDGATRGVFGPLNPQGVRIASFKAPTEPELAHDYLWHVHAQAPAKGEITVFNRSHYEDVLVVRVHNFVPKEVWEKRYRHIVNFERMLADEGTSIFKFYLHISPGEQKERLQARLDDPTKRWKFNEGDLKERELWGDYQRAYTDMLNKTSKRRAPWFVIPADDKWYRDLVIAEIMVNALEQLKMSFPPGPPNLADIKVV